MKYAICVSSLTGNTAKLAACVRDALPAADCVYFGKPNIAAAAAAELVFVGFWTDKGGCDGPTALLLHNLPGKKVVLFATAGFGASADYFDQILTRVSSNLPSSAAYLGGAMCTGQMPPAVLEKYERLAQDTENPLAPRMIAVYHAALGHPNDDDCTRVAAFAAESLARASL